MSQHGPSWFDDNQKPIFEIGDRVRSRMHPQWHGTVVSRSLRTIISVNWDGHGVEMIDSGLLERVVDNGRKRSS
jgi:hypothetical protein